MSAENRYKFLYIHSGGVTAVLNRALYTISNYALKNNITCVISPQGIVGALKNHFIELTQPMSEAVASSPASFMASARYYPNDHELEKILNNLIAYGINGLIMQGGDDSQKTLLRLQNMARLKQLPLQCIGLPKTIDNDLAGIYVSPGYPSAAKYLAVSFMEAAWDMMSMHQTSTKVFVLETMGRSSGWLAAATTVASHRYNLPHILCVPEHHQNRHALEEAIRTNIAAQGYCMITIAEGYNFEKLAVRKTDPFGHPELGHQGPLLASWIEHSLKVKVRYARPDCLQRSAGHMTALYDWELSDQLAEKAVTALLEGISGIMLATSEREVNSIFHHPLEQVADQTRMMPSEFLTPTGHHTTQAFIDYLEPLITGEVPLSFDRGLPHYQFPLHTNTTKEAVL